MESKRKISKLIPIFLGLFMILMVAGYYTYRYYSKFEVVNQEEQLINEFLEEEIIEAPIISVINEEPEKKQEDSIKYWAVLEIPNIGLKKGLCWVNEKCNNVSKNIKVIEKSNKPDVDKGNLILAGHNGNSNVSFFNKLDRLSNGDNIYVYYNGKKYEYKLNKHYEIKKTGKAVIHRDNTETTLVLVTCKKNSKDKQVVYIAYLTNVTNY